MARNEKLLQIAEGLKPKLVVIQKEIPGENRVLKKGDEACFDFDDHYVGYLTIDFESTGRH